MTRGGKPPCRPSCAPLQPTTHLPRRSYHAWLKGMSALQQVAQLLFKPQAQAGRRSQVWQARAVKAPPAADTQAADVLTALEVHGGFSQLELEELPPGKRFRLKKPLYFKASVRNRDCEPMKLRCRRS